MNHLKKIAGIASSLLGIVAVVIFWSANKLIAIILVLIVISFTYSFLSATKIIS